MRRDVTKLETCLRYSRGRTGRQQQMMPVVISASLKDVCGQLVEKQYPFLQRYRTNPQRPTVMSP